MAKIQDAASLQVKSYKKGDDVLLPCHEEHPFTPSPSPPEILKGKIGETVGHILLFQGLAIWDDEN